MIYKLISLLTATGTTAFVIFLLLAIGGGSRENTQLLGAALAAAAVGLLTMIWHLNTHGLPVSTKTEWRTNLVYFGPAAAAAYLWSVPGADKNVGKSNDKQARQVIVIVVLAAVGVGSTLLIAQTMPSVDVISDRGDLALYYLLRLGGVLSVAATATLFGVSYSRLTYWILIPSLAALFLSLVQYADVAVAMVGAGLLLAWAVAGLTKRIV